MLPPGRVAFRSSDVTPVVRVATGALQMDKPLEPGDELRCPHCRRWHQVVRRRGEGTEYTRRMLYFVCQQNHYYAGRVGTPTATRTA
jgi:hypothetical protein